MAFFFRFEKVLRPGIFESVISGKEVYWSFASILRIFFGFFTVPSHLMDWAFSMEKTNSPNKLVFHAVKIFLVLNLVCTNVMFFGGAILVQKWTIAFGWVGSGSKPLL